MPARAAGTRITRYSGLLQSGRVPPKSWLLHVQARLTGPCQANIVVKTAGYKKPVLGLAVSGKTITRADLCEAVYQKVGLSRTESAALVELVLQELSDCLERGETVKLSSFGSFVVRKKGQRIGRNPKTGKEVPISPRRVMVFKPSAILKQRINGAEGEIT